MVIAARRFSTRQLTTRPTAASLRAPRVIRVYAATISSAYRITVVASVSRMEVPAITTRIAAANFATRTRTRVGRSVVCPAIIARLIPIAAATRVSGVTASDGVPPGALVV